MIGIVTLLLDVWDSEPDVAPVSLQTVDALSDSDDPSPEIGMSALVSPPIHILEKDANRRGDLFAKLMKDLFHALGFNTTRTNLHKTGREVDLLGRHRVEETR